MPGEPSQRQGDLSKFLRPTPVIDSDHPDIVDKATELTRDCRSRAEKAKALFEFVRDFHNYGFPESYRASETLKTGGCSCYHRSILLNALCRAVAIPARLHLQRGTLKDRQSLYDLPELMEQEELLSQRDSLGGQVEAGRAKPDASMIHMISGIYLDGHWRLCDTEGYAAKWVFWTQDREEASRMPLEFSADRDSLLPQHGRVVFETLPVCFADFSEKMAAFLAPTQYVDRNHPKIVATATELTRGCQKDAEAAQALFEFVRDSSTDDLCDTRVASEVLECGGNSCRNRSILLAALCRAVGIPARLHYQRVVIRNWKDPRDGENKDITFAHGITGIYLDEEWHLYESVGNREKWIAWTGDERRGSEMPVEFRPDRDCLFEQDEEITIETLPVHFADWGDEIVELIESIDDM